MPLALNKKGKVYLKTVKPRKRAKKALKSVSKLKKELDHHFSLYIRQKYADKNGLVACCTCGALKPISDMQNGHYESRKHNSLRYSEKNCHPQCVSCNVFKSGNMSAYARFMIKTYGADVLEELAKEKNKITQFTRDTLLTLIEKYSP